MARVFGIVVVIGAMLCGWSPQGTAQVAPEGCWRGTFGQGGEQRRIVLELARNADGTYGARLHRLTSKIGSDSLNATLTRQTLAFGNEQFSFKGDFSADGTVLAGEIVRDGKKLPAALARSTGDDAAALALVGNWAGVLEQEGIPRLRLVIKIGAAPCGQVLVTMDSPDQGASDLPVTSLAVTPDSLHFEMGYVGGRYEAAIDAARSKLTGKWSQAGLTFKLDLARTDSLPQPRRPQEPQKPYPYREEEVTYENAKLGVKLAGTLTLPQGSGPFPAVLLLSGSGAQNRDEAIMGHKPFLVLADHLTRQGVAVLRVDDRGVGGSTGNLFTADLEDNTSDALAGVAFLRSRQDVVHKKIGLIGHSEGGLVAPLAATRSSGVAFIVLLAGPAVPLDDLLLEQEATIARANGASDSLIAASRRVSMRLYDILASDTDDSTAERRLRAAMAQAQPELATAQRSAADSVIVRAWATQLESQLQMLTTRWLRHLLQHDPAPVLRRVRVPVLALFGGKDLQVSAAQSAPAMENALRTGKNKDFAVEVLPGLNHLFQHAETGRVDEYARIEETIAPEVLERIGGWVGARTGK